MYINKNFRSDEKKNNLLFQNFQIIRPLSCLFLLFSTRADITALILINPRPLSSPIGSRSEGEPWRKGWQWRLSRARAMDRGARAPLSPLRGSSAHLRSIAWLSRISPRLAYPLLALRPATRITRSRDLMQAFTIVTAPIRYPRDR